MRRNKNIWEIGKEGNLIFPTEGEVLRLKYSPQTLFEKPIVAYIVMIACAVLDAVVFNQMFARLLRERWELRTLSCIGMLFGFDFAPIYLGMKLREKNQGYKVDKMLIRALALSFAAAFVINIVLRFAMKDVILPPQSTKPSSIMATNISVQQKNPLAPIYAFFAAVLPLITSLCSFGVSYAVANPLKTEMENLDTQLLMLQHDSDQAQSIIAEYEADEDMVERLKGEDNEKYNAASNMIREQAVMYTDYVRQRIKEHLGEPAPINELSKPHHAEYFNRLNETIQADVSGISENTYN